MYPKNFLIIAGLLPLSIFANPSDSPVTFAENFADIGYDVALETSEQWTLLTGDSYRGDGEGRVSVPSVNFNISTVAESTIVWNGEDFELQCDFDLNGRGGDNVAGVAWGIQDSGNYYTAHFFASGSVVVQRFVDGLAQHPPLCFEQKLFNNRNSGSKDVDSLRIILSYSDSTSSYTVNFVSLSGGMTGSIAESTFTDSMYGAGRFGLFGRYGGSLAISHFSVKVSP